MSLEGLGILEVEVKEHHSGYEVTKSARLNLLTRGTILPHFYFATLLEYAQMQLEKYIELSIADLQRSLSRHSDPDRDCPAVVADLARFERCKQYNREIEIPVWRFAA